MGARSSKTHPLYHRFSRYEQDTLRRLFLELAAPNHGKYMDKNTFLKLFQMPGILGERLFGVFDQRGNCSIDYDDFVDGLGAFIRGSLDDKITFLFRLYDVGNRGAISRQELSTVLNSVVYGWYLIATSAADSSRIPDDVTQFIDQRVKKLVDDAFRDAATASLTPADFQRWVLENPQVLDVIEFLIRERSTVHHATVSPYNRMTFDKIMHTSVAENDPGAGARPARDGLADAAQAPGDGRTSPMQDRLRPELFFSPGDADHNRDLSDIALLRQQTEPFLGELDGWSGYMEGWLNQKSRLLPFILCHRWVVLRDNFLYVFASQTDAQPLSVIGLEGCYAEPITCGARYGLEIHSPISAVHRHLFCEDQGAQHKWLQAVKIAARQFRLEEYYDIGRQLGVGRFSHVYVCTRKTSGARYAVKILDKKGVDARDLDALRTEIAVLQYVHHPNIVHLKNVFETRTRIFILMTLISGGELFDRIKSSGRLSEPQAQIATKQILLALKYLHERGIIHRDLKPENIMMVSEDVTDFRISLVDFGLSKFIAPDEMLRQSCGTLAYVAPEVLQGKPYGHEVDLWSVGVITYAMLRNRLPFADGNGAAVDKALRWQVPLSDPIWSEVSDAGKCFVRGMLNPDPGKRYTIDRALNDPWLQTALLSTTYPNSAPTMKSVV